MHPKDTIPFGYCHCGCGDKTPIAKQTYNSKGIKAGLPLRYIRGHNGRVQFTVDPTATSKVCSGCGIEKVLEAFGKVSKMRDGRSSRCKECLRQYYREYYRNNSEKHLERTSDWNKRNPEKRKAIKRRRHFRERGAEGWLGAEDWQRILDTYGHRCLRCGRDDVPLEADHVIPVALGGTSDPENIQPLCKPCNTSKGAKIMDFRTRCHTQLGLGDLHVLCGDTSDQHGNPRTE